MKQLVAILILLVILIAGCTEQSTNTPNQIMCPDGSVVSDASLCPSSTNPPSTPNSNELQNYSFTSYENQELYYGVYCDKINPYDLNVRKAAADAIRNHSGNYNINQLFDIYDWVKENIIYQNVPLAGIPYQPSDTLTTKSGDCKNQAVLIASMIESIGGTAKFVADPDCEHAYTIVYFGPSGSDVSWFTQEVASHYGSNAQVRYFISDSDIWVIFDPAGGNYPGNTLPECSGNRNVYFITSCLDCINQYPNEPYKFGDKCYSQCPSGTIIANQHACKSCPTGSYSCNNQCLSCSSGYIMGTDCLCHQPCGSSTTYCQSGSCYNGRCV